MCQVGSKRGPSGVRIIHIFVRDLQSAKECVLTTDEKDMLEVIMHFVLR